MGTEKGLIFGSCPCEDWTFLQPYLQWPQVVVGADGGLDAARQAGFVPTVYVGDGDSGGSAEQGLQCIPLKPEKDFTDLEAAYDWSKEYGLRELIFTGCTGGRQDHHLAALALLERATRDGIRALILAPDNRIEFLLPGRYRLKNHGYHYVSLLPVDPVLEKVSLSGLKYPLKDRDVQRGSSLTVSNEFLGDQAELIFCGGCCYLIESN